MTPPGFNPYVPRPIDLPTTVPLDPAADLSVLDEAKILAPPDDPAAWPAWREAITRWRTEARARLHYRDTHYDEVPNDLFSVALAWLWDETLYDHDRGRFTVDRYVDETERDFGDLDGIALWHAYPVIGIDDRDHLTLYRQISELPDVVRAFRRRGVRAFITYYPWERGDGPDTIRQIADIVRWSGVDGVFLDTVREGAAGLREALDAIRPGLTLEGESKVPLARVHDHSLSWAQWFADSPVPGVLKTKWFERRHILHHTRRWHRSHLDELHSAWLNGVGVLLWENVFGVWVGWNERDRALYRAMRSVQRSHAAWLQSEAWAPLADHPGGGRPVYASRWEHDGVALWTIVNRGDALDGAWLEVEAVTGGEWRELTAGTALRIEPAGPGRITVGGSLAAGGIAAVVRENEGSSAMRVRGITEVAGARGREGDGSPAMRIRGITGEAAAEAGGEPGAGGRANDGVPAMRVRGIAAAAEAGVHAEPTATFPARAVVRRPVGRVDVRDVPGGMVAVEPFRGEITVRYRMRESGLYGEALWVDEWKPLPPRLHATATLVRPVDVAPFAIGEREVTHAEFAAFIEATGYRPIRPERFDLAGHGPADEPVTHVELADARAYAAWTGWRLPTEDEWQVAGEAGLLRFGTPRVWNLTESEHSDGRTRFVIVKGGSDFDATGSDWYFDGGPREPDWSARLLLTGAGMGRSPWIGFRCAVDLPA